MSFKEIFVLGSLALGGAYFTGALESGYSRSVDRPPAQVMAALEDLDIRDQPGAPGTDPSRSGGVQPLFKQESTADSMTWIVMSGDEVAVRMTAKFKPLSEGKRTQVTAHVERGDAPDDFVAPAFRSTGTTKALFAMALESELNDLTRPRADPAKCRELMARFEDGALEQGPPPRAEDLSGAMGQTATAIVRLSAMEAELRRNGCKTDGGGEFRPARDSMARG